MPNSDKLMKERLERFRENEGPAKILLHTCCCPCLVGCIERLKEESVDLFFYNPNIATKREFELRKSEIERYLRLTGSKNMLLSEEYDHQQFTDQVRGLEEVPEGGARCFLCYEQRLRETAKKAKSLGYHFFATTLTLSPLKRAERINSIGEKIGREIGIEYLPSDFKKRDGFKRSVQISKEYDLYRQNYCGCEFSRKEEE